MVSVAEQFEPEETPTGLYESPLAGALCGETHALNLAHAHARVALLNSLNDNETIIALFDHWAETTTLGQRAARAAKTLDELAQLLGYDDRSALHSDEAMRRMEPGTITVELECEPSEAEIERLRNLPEEASAALDEMLDALAHACDETPNIGQALLQLVRDEWHLDYPWLVLELLQRWLLSISYGAIGLQPMLTIWYEPKSPLDLTMPPLSLSIATMPDETLGNFLARIGQELDRAIVPAIDEVLESAADEIVKIPNGRRTDPQIITRYVGWWYRHRIVKESINSIAKDATDEDRSLIRHGLRRADYWLSLSQFGWKDPGDELA